MSVEHSSNSKVSAQNFINLLTFATKEQKKDYDKNADDVARKQEITSETKHKEQQTQTIKKPLLEQTVARSVPANSVKDVFIPQTIENGSSLTSKQLSDLPDKVQNLLKFLKVMSFGETQDSESTLNKSAIVSQDTAKTNNSLKSAKNAVNSEDFEGYTGSKNADVTEESKKYTSSKNSSLSSPSSSFEEDFPTSNTPSSSSIRNTGNTNTAVCSLFKNQSLFIQAFSANTRAEINSEVQTSLTGLDLQKGYYNSVTSGIESAFNQQQIVSTQMTSQAVLNAASQASQAGGQFLQAATMSVGTNKLIGEKFGNDEFASMAAAFKENMLEGPSNNKTNFTGLGINEEFASDLGFKPGGTDALNGTAKGIVTRFEANKISLSEAVNQFKKALVENLEPVHGVVPNTVSEVKARIENFNAKVKTLMETNNSITATKNKPLLASAQEDSFGRPNADASKYNPTVLAGARRVGEHYDVATIAAAGASAAGGRGYLLTDAAGVALPVGANATEMMTAIRGCSNVSNDNGTILSKNLAVSDADSRLGVTARKQITFVECDVAGNVKVTANVMKQTAANGPWESENGIATLAEFTLDPATPIGATTIAGIRKKVALDVIEHSGDLALYKSTTIRAQTLDMNVADLKELNRLGALDDPGFAAFDPASPRFRNAGHLQSYENTINTLERGPEPAAGPALDARRQYIAQARLVIATCKGNREGFIVSGNLDDYLLGTQTAGPAVGGVIPRNPDGIIGHADVDGNFGDDFHKFQQYAANAELMSPLLTKLGIAEDPSPHATSLAARMGAHAQIGANKTQRNGSIFHGIMQGGGAVTGGLAGQAQAQFTLNQSQAQQTNAFMEKTKTVLSGVVQNQGTAKQSIDTAASGSVQAMENMNQAVAQGLTAAAR